ncbi:SDR family NAD(P)-dependent oxidoreductase [Brevibacterium antiquum]|uniref:NAD(P)-dependent dehydrogenase, short-chain alcohol dehydrogenase family n=1 Tax=Brevibacterium antiquum CNRZ 918 TaxID=1255637 RepID=A0A2H1JR16_9MICO|nr:SDR family oxidoreductase [Brevibacterium antiquum]SMX89881.1 NAD(P)-dependent dehydrogenase, short-chain alcohol dehydrogenase family [Brevibacterium antiquum CNRZ 918]
MDLGISGKTAMVTGGTRGIGRAIVERFLAEGAHVAFCARNGTEVAEAEEALARDGKAVGTVLDVSDATSLSAWVEATAAEFGGIDMVVNSVSALAIPDTEENWYESFNVDMMGTVHLSKLAIPYLEKSEVASLVSISSVSGREADFASGPYGTMKTAIIGYMAGLALSLADKRIRVNTVSPGNTYHEEGVWPGIESSNPELFAQAMGLNPTGRMGTPEETAASVVFLSSPLSSRTTGANLLIDGALTRGIQF